MAIQWNSQAVIDKQRAGAVKGMEIATEALRGEAVDLTPIKDGVLRASSKASVNEVDDGVVGAVSFNTEYAVKQHEDVGLNHPNGGEAKYLENAATAFSETFQTVMAHQIKKALRR
ncbi:hypothetical protein CH289_07645 [Rhodococcus sp. RS1C4]|nr:hypothetical protein [Rhodococcus sp. RS1C4]OZC55059.1 hypothetical protein CH289_07645 [Rhodococcus sp. RS1C4]